MLQWRFSVLEKERGDKVLIKVPFVSCLSVVLVLNRELQ